MIREGARAAQAEKGLVVVAGHDDVEVVVPGDESLMAQRADEGAVGQEVGEAMLGAHAIQLAQRVELDLLDLLFRERFHRWPFSSWHRIRRESSGTGAPVAQVRAPSMLPVPRPAPSACRARSHALPRRGPGV